MKFKKNGKFFKSLRFRILIILIILGIVPSVIVTEMVIANYEDRAIANRVQSMENICDIMCDLLIKENYLNDSSSQTVNSKLELLSNIYGGRILIVDRDFRIIKDTYGVDEGKTLVSQKVVNCFKGEDAYRYDSDSQKLILAVPVKSPEVNQVQGAMMIMASSSEVTSTIRELEQKGILIIGIIVVLAIFLGYILSTVLVKPFARVTKAIEDLTDGYQNEEISVPDYTETALITDAFNKMLSRMKTLDESRQEFVSNVSHELKTPMTSMKVLADSLVGQQGVPEELYQEFLSDITEEIDRENKIITDLLSLVKMDKKAADMNITNMNINELLENILKRLRPIADQRSISLILDSFRPVNADVDEVKFTLAISNLVENGIKYNVDEGWVRVTLDADHKDFFVTVEDSGLGIPEESIERIFERFYRVDKSHSREIGGTGLGLAITRSSIAMHHGIIKVSSKEGEGTTFTFRLPFTVSETAASETTTVGEDISDLLRDRKILLVEDNEINMEIAQFYLEEAGAKVEKAWNGQEAVALFSQNPAGSFDAILMDVMMPVMDGMEATQRIRDLKREDAASIPIIAMTAQTTADIRETCRKAGMDDYIAKPIREEELAKVIRKSWKVKKV